MPEDCDVTANTVTVRCFKQFAFYFPDIPLLPAMSSSPNGNEVQFVVHWLNNKELQFTLEAEKILSEMNKGGMAMTEDTETDDRDTQGETTEDEEKMVNGDATAESASDAENIHKGNLSDSF